MDKDSGTVKRQTLGEYTMSERSMWTTLTITPERSAKIKDIDRCKVNGGKHAEIRVTMHFGTENTSNRYVPCV